MSEQQQMIRWGVIAWSLGALFFLFEFFLRVFPGTISERLIHEFNLTPGQFALMGSVYYLSYSLLQIPLSFCLGRYGVKRIVLISVLICSLSLAGFILSDSYYELLAARFFMGLGSCAAFAALLLIGYDWFSDRYYGFLAGSTQILGALGPILAGVPFVSAIGYYHGNWRIVLWFVTASGICIALLIFIMMRNSKADYVRLKEASLPKLWQGTMSLVKSKKITWVAVYAFLSYATMPVLGAIWGELYVQSIGFGQKQAAAVVSALWLGLSLGSPFMGLLSDVMKTRKWILVFCSALGLCVSTMLLLKNENVSVMYLTGLFFGLGLAGASQSLSFTVLSEMVSKDIYSCAIGLNNTAVMLGGLLIPPFVALLLKSILNTQKLNSTQIAQHFTENMGILHHGLRLALCVIPIIYMIGIVVSLFFIQETYPSERIPKAFI